LQTVSLELLMASDNEKIELPKVSQHGISQKALNELAEDWAAMADALLPFASLAEVLPPVILGRPRPTDVDGVALVAGQALDPNTTRTVTFGHLREALRVLKLVTERFEARRITSAERSIAGHGDICHLCGSVIEGADDHELAGYCSQTCQREDAGKADFGQFEIAPNTIR
jgi:hypothetical protein